jgi:hypothetical protein
MPRDVPILANLLGSRGVRQLDVKIRGWGATAGHHISGHRNFSLGAAGVKKKMLVMQRPAP